MQALYNYVFIVIIVLWIGASNNILQINLYTCYMITDSYIVKV